jgi:hypothetical protein
LAIDENAIAPAAARAAGAAAGVDEAACAAEGVCAQAGCESRTHAKTPILTVDFIEPSRLRGSRASLEA